jgi:hypothetical protein
MHAVENYLSIIDTITTASGKYALGLPQGDNPAETGTKLFLSALSTLRGWADTHGGLGPIGKGVTRWIKVALLVAKAWNGGLSPKNGWDIASFFASMLNALYSFLPPNIRNLLGDVGGNVIKSIDNVLSLIKTAYSAYESINALGYLYASGSIGMLYAKNLVGTFSDQQGIAEAAYSELLAMYEMGLMDIIRDMLPGITAAVTFFVNK